MSEDDLFVHPNGAAPALGMVRRNRPFTNDAPLAAEGTDELREALVADIVAEIHRVQLDRGIGMSVFGRIAIADALLAGPLAPLLAKLRAVEALADEYADPPGLRTAKGDLSTLLRRALDGPR